MWATNTLDVLKSALLYLERYCHARATNTLDVLKYFLEYTTNNIPRWATNTLDVLKSLTLGNIRHGSQGQRTH